MRYICVMENNGYRQERLRHDFPELASTFETILESGLPDVKKTRYLYYPAFLTSQRNDKGLSLQKIIGIVRDHGYEVEIKTKLVK